MAGAVGAWSTARAAGNNVALDQFIPDWSGQKRRQSADQMIAIMRDLQRRVRKRGKKK